MDSIEAPSLPIPASFDDSAIGETIYALAKRIFPLCRSITGSGVRETIAILRDYIDVERQDVSSGTAVFDWIVPNEWNARDAYVLDASGRRVIDFRVNSLHLMSYSTAVRSIMPLSALKAHLYTLPEQPDVIPYKTSYYADAWGFCLSHRDLQALEEGDYEVVIDTEKAPGHLSYGEYVHPGTSDAEVLFYTHICHPSMANDNCSGLALLTCLAASMKGVRTHYSYRFVFAPGTIGSLTWLSRNESRLEQIAHGLVVSCVGDGGHPTYKQSRRGDAIIDQIAACVGCGDQGRLSISEFSPYGYDERQFCSPGFNLPVGLLQRSPHGTFPEYHTSADNLDFIRPEHLAASFRIVKDMIEALENNWIPLNLSPKGEPHLSKYDLFSTMGGHKVNSQRTMAYLWILNLADGHHSLLDIARRSQIVFAEIAAAAESLRQVGLLSNLGPVRS